MPPVADLVLFAAAIAAAGVVSGLLAGIFGIGGGAILVPVFYQVFGYLDVPEAVRMHLSVGTSIAIIVPTSLRSFTAHRKRGAVDMVINTPTGSGARSDGYEIRSAAVRQGIPCVTTMTGATAASRAIVAGREREDEPVSLQELHGIEPAIGSRHPSESQ